MKIFNNILGFIIVLSFIFLFGCGGGGGGSKDDSSISPLFFLLANNNRRDDPRDDPVKKSWLFLVYIAGDNDDIIYNQLENLDSLETVGSDENTHIVAYIDIGDPTNKNGWNNSKWSNSINWKGARGYYIKKDDKLNSINSKLIKDYGDVDSGSKDFLSTCLKEAMTKYPADNVCLVLNNHGGGYYGLLIDDSAGSIMTNVDVKEAIKEAEEQTKTKINILGFDACVMAELEPCYEYKDVIDYIIGSEELTSSIGWHYEEILTSSNESTKTICSNSKFGILPKATKILQNRYKEYSKENELKDVYSKISSEITPKQFAEIIFDIQKEYPEEVSTFAIIDSSKLEDLKNNIDNFAKAVIATDEDNLTKIKNNILLNPNKESAWNYGFDYNFFDLYNMMNSISSCADITDDNV
ncbi:hypothetical protein IJJ97_01385, partial [bacterium]|nr:hypothetical protein [bacterium]